MLLTGNIWPAHLGEEQRRHMTPVLKAYLFCLFLPSGKRGREQASERDTHKRAAPLWRRSHRLRCITRKPMELAHATHASRHNCRRRRRRRRQLQARGSSTCPISHPIETASTSTICGQFFSLFFKTWRDPEPPHADK